MSAYQWHCVKGGVTHCKLNLLQLNLQRTPVSSISFVQRFTFGKFLSQYYPSKTYTNLKNGGLSAQLPLHNCFNPSQKMNETKKISQPPGMQMLSTRSSNYQDTTAVWNWEVQRKGIWGICCSNSSCPHTDPTERIPTSRKHFWDWIFCSILVHQVELFPLKAPWAASEWISKGDPSC